MLKTKEILICDVCKKESVPTDICPECKLDICKYCGIEVNICVQDKKYPNVSNFLNANNLFCPTCAKKAESELKEFIKIKGW